MLNLILTRPSDAFTEYKIQGSGAFVTGATTLYKLREFCPNPGFDNGTAPWGWLRNGEFDNNSPNVLQAVYNEAYSGRGSAEVIFNVDTDELAVNLSSNTNRGSDISELTLTVSAYIKTTSNNLGLFFYIPNVTLQALPIASTSGRWEQRSATFVVPQISEQDKIFTGIYCNGTGSLFVDMFSITAEGVYSDIPDYTYVTLNPGWNLSSLINATDYQNFYLYFVDGINQKIVAPIRSVVVQGGVVTRIDLYDILPYPVASGTLVSVLQRNNRYVSSAVYTICDKLLSCEVETSLDEGYNTANISLLKMEIYTAVGHTDLLLWRGTLQNEHGELFDGVITGIEENEDTCTLTLNGFSFFLKTQRYVGYFPSSEDITIRYVLDDMLQSVPEINAQNGIIDRDNAISSLQATAGGIGPLDFSEGNQTVKECIDKILKLGTYDDSFDALFLQIYSGAIPILKRIPRVIMPQHVRCFADQNNLRTKVSTRSANVSELKTLHYAIYTGNQGQQGETAWVGESRYLVQYGPLINSISSGNLTKEEAYIVLQNMIFDMKHMRALTNVELMGTLGTYANGPGIHVSQIRAGDIILLNGNFYDLTDRSDLSQYYGILIVGNTRYNALEQVLTITPYEHATNVESLLGVLEIEG